ncbi:hypothetical protein BDP27DRAFT_1405002 [Rhodocollybia butyracea]|uniref:Protein kinase domain-containing protein n=1 Tax=Rhodocollybia butyracea TaxID=206335 RepID=A0A9P5PGS4_9AGAR|nr:hypothetical protein BDP27DRAFT_1405002 [Rhodocollybia butyracea]
MVPESGTQSATSSTIPPTAPATPKRKPLVGPSPVETTPMSKTYASHSTSHNASGDLDVKQLAEVVNKFFADDLAQSLELSMEDFATLILSLPKDWDGKAEFDLGDNQVFLNAWEEYLQLLGKKEGEEAASGDDKVSKKTLETQLYAPLVSLLNAVGDSSDNENLKAFYIQDPRPVLGSRISRVPDIAAIYRQLLAVADDETLDEYLRENRVKGVFWGLLLYFVEVKNKNGAFLRKRSDNIKEETSQVATSKGSHGPSQPKSQAKLSKSSGKKRRKSPELAEDGAPESSEGSQQAKRSKGKATSGKGSTQPTRIQPARSTKSSSKSETLHKQVLSSSRAASRSTPTESSEGGSSTKGKSRARPKVTGSETGQSSAGLHPPPTPETSFDRYKKQADEERRVEAQLQDGEGYKRTREQGASYAKEMLSFGVIRHHAIGLTVDAVTARFFYADRSKIVESKPCDITQFKRLFMAMVLQLHRLTPEKLGVIQGLDFDYRNPEKINQTTPTKTLYETLLSAKGDALVGATYTFTGSKGLKRVEITRVIFRSEGIVGRSSIVVEVKCVCDRCSGDDDCGWKEKELVMKVSFPSKKRIPENEIIATARKHAEEHDQLWALNHLPLVEECITFPYDATDTVQGRLKDHFKDEYEERVMRVTFLKKLKPLKDLPNPREIAQVFFDILQIHQWLYEQPGVLHRDLSMGNIMWYRVDGKVYGVLNDYDLASYEKDKDKGPTSDHRTGTKPFMAFDLLDEDWKGGHYYRHDMESLFYIILCFACRYRFPNVPAQEPRKYEEWFTGSERQVYQEKYTLIMSKSVSTFAVQEHFTHFAPWLEKIYFRLHTGHFQRPSSITLRFDPHASQEFDWFTLNGNFSYHRLNEVMNTFKGMPLEARWTDETRNPNN